LQQNWKKKKERIKNWLPRAIRILRIPPFPLLPGPSGKRRSRTAGKPQAENPADSRGIQGTAEKSRFLPRLYCSSHPRRFLMTLILKRPKRRSRSSWSIYRSV
jgi:hypothetical protein